MGLDIQAWVGYGVRIQADWPPYRRDIIVPSCEHDERLGQRYCPICGLMVEDYVRRGTDLRIHALVEDYSGVPPWPRIDHLRARDLPELRRAYVIADYFRDGTLTDIWVLGWYAEGKCTPYGGPVRYSNFTGINLERAAALVNEALCSVGLEPQTEMHLIVNSLVSS